MFLIILFFLLLCDGCVVSFVSLSYTLLDMASSSSTDQSSMTISRLITTRLSKLSFEEMVKQIEKEICFFPSKDVVKVFDLPRQRAGFKLYRVFVPSQAFTPLPEETSYDDDYFALWKKKNEVRQSVAHPLTCLAPKTESDVQLVTDPPYYKEGYDCYYVYVPEETNIFDLSQRIKNENYVKV